MISTSTNQNKIVRYGFWTAAILMVAIAGTFFASFFNSQMVTKFPDGFKFIVTDNSSKNQSEWTTYYVYDTYIIVSKEKTDESAISPNLVYEGLNTSTLVYKKDEVSKKCDSEACYSYPKVVDSIKKLLIGRPSREYVRY